MDGTSLVVPALVSTLVLASGVGLPLVGTALDQPKPMWRSGLVSWGMPLVVDEDLYVLGTQHSVSNLDAASGVKKWSVATGGASDNGNSRAMVLRTNGSVLVVGDCSLEGFDRLTGRRLWTAASESCETGVFVGPIVDDVVYVGSGSGTMFAISARTGEELWRRKVSHAGRVTVFTPAVRDGTAIAGFTQFDRGMTAGVVALRLRDGAEVWERTMPGSPSTSVGFAGGPVLSEKTAFVSTSDGGIYSLRLKDGDLSVVEAPTPPSPHGRPLDYLPLAADARNLVAGSTVRGVRVFDVGTLKLRWSEDRSQSVGSVGRQIALMGNQVLVPYYSGRIVSFDVMTGARRWQLGSGSQMFPWLPAFTATAFYLDGPQGVYAFRR